MSDELVPHAVLVLIAQQRLHHAAISLQNPGALRMTGGQRAEHLRHASGNPTVATSPEEGHVGSVKEKAVPLLQLVEIGDHFVRSAVEVLTIAGGAIGDRKSTRLNSSHQIISYAVFCLKKKNKK